MRRHYRPLFMQPVSIWLEMKPVNNVRTEEERQRHA
jgi:hypothetical protein